MMGVCLRRLNIQCEYIQWHSKKLQKNIEFLTGWGQFC